MSLIAGLKTIRRRALQGLHHMVCDRRYAHWEPNSTRTFLGIDNLDPLESKNLAQAREYVPSPRLVVRWILDELRKDYTRFSFVDFGSGKGRVVVTAAEKPFRLVRGVEFSRPLHAVAASFIKQMPTEFMICHDTRSVCCDAVDFDPSEGDTIYYFYNPFGRKVIKQVIQKGVKLHKSGGHRLLVVLYNPVHHEFFDNHPDFHPVEFSFWHKVKMLALSPYPVSVYELIGYAK